MRLTMQTQTTDEKTTQVHIPDRSLDITGAVAPPIELQCSQDQNTHTYESVTKYHPYFPKSLHHHRNRLSSPR